MFGIVFRGSQDDGLVVVPCTDRAEAESLASARRGRLVESGPDDTWRDPGEDVEELPYNVMYYATVADFRAGGTVTIWSWPPSRKRW